MHARKAPPPKLTSNVTTDMHYRKTTLNQNYQEIYKAFNTPNIDKNIEHVQC